MLFILPYLTLFFKKIRPFTVVLHPLKFSCICIPTVCKNSHFSNLSSYVKGWSNLMLPAFSLISYMTRFAVDVKLNQIVCFFVHPKLLINWGFFFQGSVYPIHYCWRSWSFNHSASIEGAWLLWIRYNWIGCPLFWSPGWWPSYTGLFTMLVILFS